jgi:hypothetical protein
MRSSKDQAGADARPAPAGQARPIDAPALEDVTHGEVLGRYPGQWILMRVTSWDERYYPERGYLLAHSDSRADVDKARLEAIRAPDSLPGTLSVFEAYPPIRSQDEWLAALERVADEWEGDPFDLRPTRSLGLVELDDEGNPHLIEPPWPVCRISKHNKPARG